MRLPVINGERSDIDVDAAREMIKYAIDSGINYFDTAWVYHGGNSETVLGDLLSEYPRESYYLATKFPGFVLDLIEKVEEIFTKQLEKCKVDYFDFYLFHDVCETNIDQYLDEKYRIYDYLMEQKRLGKIKHLGFSTHGSLQTINRFLDAYGKDMEFCQIQLNYFDHDYQDAKAKVDLLRKHNIPIWVMEPVRGGKLATLKKEHEDILKALRPDESIAAWAFRYLQGYDDVIVTLSGMSNMDQLSENVKTYSALKPLKDEEMTALRGIASEMIASSELACTACRYCTEGCPVGLDIPALINLYNRKKTQSGAEDAEIPSGKLPNECIGCRSCEILCPQGIKISEAMADLCKMI